MIMKYEQQKSQQQTKNQVVNNETQYQRWIAAITSKTQHPTIHDDDDDDDDDDDNRKLECRTKKKHHSKKIIISDKPKFDKNKSTIPFIYRLPDDVLIYLLVECPIIDFDTLCALLYTCKKLRHIGCQVLRYYLLPYIRLATVIDQEGHGKWTCIYAFDAFNEDTLHASFKPINYKGQRYRYDPSTNAPTLRYILATTMCHEIRSASITHQSLINNAINNNINKNNGRHLQSSPQHCRNRSTKREQSKSKNIASWMMINQEQPHKHCIINNPNCRLSVKHYSSKRVVQGTINNSITTMISCATQQEQVMWRLTYIVNTMQQELQHPLMSDHHFSALQQIYQHRHSSNNNAMIAQQQQQKIPEMDNNTNVRYMIPICLTTNIMSLSNGFTVNNKKSKSASSYGGRFVHHGTTWIKDKWRRWCL